MSLDPSTLCARTAAGDAELAAPRHGLAIALRRLLSILDHPVPLDELVQRPGVLADRVEKDLLRLAEQGLVELHGPSPTAAPVAGRPPAKVAAAPFVPVPRASAPASAPAPTPPRQEVPRPWIDAHPGLAATAGSSAPESRIVLGKRVRHGRALVLGFLTLVAVGAVVWWLAAPAHDVPAPAVLAPPASTPARRAEAVQEPVPASVPEPVRVVAMPESFVTNPAPAASSTPPSATARPPQAVPAPAAGSAIPAPTATSAEVGAAARSSPPGSQARTPVPSKPEPVAPLPEPGTVAAPAPPPSAAMAAAQPASAVTLPSAVPSPSVSQPIQVAAATPSTLASPPAGRKLVPIAREEPAFPRDALAQGVTKGTVRARVAIDASGKVTAVEILDAQPRRVFDRAVQRALGRWTYEPGEPARSADVEVSFERDPP